MKNALFSSLIIYLCFHLSSCNADAWNLQDDITDNTPDAVPDKIPETMPDEIRNILKKYYNDITTLGNGVNIQSDQQVFDYYKNQWNVSETETIKRFQTDAKRRALLPAIRKYIEDRIAGEWIQQEGDYKFIFLLKGDEVVPDWMNEIVINDVLKIVVRIGAKYSKQELLDISDSIYPNLVKEFPNLQGMGPDVKNNGISLDFYSPDKKQILKSDLIERLKKYDTEDMKKFLDMPIEINVTSAKLRTTGGIHPGASKMTNSSSYCTVAFAFVDFLLNRYFVSAGHCDGDMLFEDYGTGEKSATETIQRIWDSERDYQIFRLKTGTPTNLIYEYFRGSNTIVKSPMTYSAKEDEHHINNQVCFTGIISRKNCGRITNNNYKPTPTGGCNGQTCAATWVKVEFDRPENRCAYGDSGAPAYSGSTAYGIVSLAAWTSTQCAHIVYMPLDKIHDDWQDQKLLTTP